MGAVLTRGPVAVRPLQRRDRRAWLSLRARNADWLRPWEATLPDVANAAPMPFGQLLRAERSAWREDRGYFAVVEVNGVLAGRVSASSVRLGSERSAMMGYWIDRDMAGRGLTPLAVALLAEYCFDDRRLHRLDIAIRPQNTRSLAVPRKLGFVEEGMRRDLLHVDGAWHDHMVFAKLATDDRNGPFWAPGP